VDLAGTLRAYGGGASGDLASWQVGTGCTRDWERVEIVPRGLSFFEGSEGVIMVPKNCEISPSGNFTILRDAKSRRELTLVCIKL
jgi:hypothetical protein